MFNLKRVFGSIKCNFSVFFAWIHWDNSSALTLSYRTFLFIIHFIFLFLFDLYFCESKCFHYFIEYIKNYIINKRNLISFKFISVLFFIFFINKNKKIIFRNLKISFIYYNLFYIYLKIKKFICIKWKWLNFFLI